MYNLSFFLSVQVYMPVQIDLMHGDTDNISYVPIAALPDMATLTSYDLLMTSLNTFVKFVSNAIFSNKNPF